MTPLISRHVGFRPLQPLNLFHRKDRAADHLTVMASAGGPKLKPGFDRASDWRTNSDLNQNSAGR